MNNKSSRFYLISLGCPKNLVDSEGIAALLRRAGYTSVAVPEEADVLIVNTCGFIGPARAESQAVLRELAQSKRPDQRLIAAGCYPQYQPDELTIAVPGIDGLIGTRCWMDILDLLDRTERATAQREPICHLPDAPAVRREAAGLPRTAIQGASAYLKLADGCRRTCAFCAIPLIKGPLVSRPSQEILADARWLAEQGVQEIILIAQDITDYGHDLGEGENLPKLLERMVQEIPQVPWIRLMYAYPGRREVIDPLIETMARHPQILPYLDIPLQHAHPDVLRRMRRPSNVGEVHRTIERLRAAMPEIAIRTTFLVGFPGETKQEFQALIDFVKEAAFDRVGVFTYSQEPGTPADEMVDDVPPEVKESRRNRLMESQQPISLAKNQALIGRTLDVLIEGLGEGVSVGRSYRDAPEIDGLVLTQAELPPGEIISIYVTAALEYDLIGEPVSEG